MTTDVQERVVRGVALLDEKMPLWWLDIDLESLSLFSPTNCVVGQLYGGYNAGIEDLGLEGSDPDHPDLADDIAHGFEARWYELYEPLEDEWRRVILERRSAA